MSRVLKEYRERYGISQLKLSVKAGLSQTSVADIEREAIKNPRIETLIGIAQTLELEAKETADLIGINIYGKE
ncbi:helix-turn-helix domain-containing protein [Candidatus Dojkabacteria bacterium]|nr:helix-turn-helix domain-containing protein [Candidatus Dojkabacteria bacterium]